MANVTDESHPSSSPKIPAGAVHDDVGVEELGDDAQIWRDCEKITNDEDNKLVERWNNGLNDLAIFAALFSAVTTTFIVEAQQDMKEDYAKQSFLALNAIASGTKFEHQPFVVPGSARIVNCVWIASLILSLAAAFIAIMGKDWISMYRYRPVCNPRQWAEIRTYRLRNVEKWRMSGVIGTAPVLLHLSLILFGAGLVLFISDDPLTHRLTLGLTVASGSLYTVTGLTAVMFAGSPFKSPESQSLRSFIAFLYRSFCSIVLATPPLPASHPPLSAAQQRPGSAGQTLPSAGVEAQSPPTIATGQALVAAPPSAAAGAQPSLALATGQSLPSAGAQQQPGPAGHALPSPRAAQQQLVPSRHTPEAQPPTTRAAFDATEPTTLDKLSQVFLSTTWTDVNKKPIPHILAEALSRLRDASPYPRTLDSIVIALGDIHIAPELARHVSQTVKDRIRDSIHRQWKQRDLRTLSRYILALHNLGSRDLSYEEVEPSFEKVLEVAGHPDDPTEDVWVALFLISDGFAHVSGSELVTKLCPRQIAPRTIKFLVSYFAQPRSDANCRRVINLVNSCSKSLNKDYSALLHALKYHLEDYLGARLPLTYSTIRPQSAIDFLSFVLSQDEISGDDDVRKAAADLIATIIAAAPPYEQHPCLVFSFGRDHSANTTSVWDARKIERWSAEELRSILRALPLLEYDGFTINHTTLPPLHAAGHGFVECLVRTVTRLLFPQRPWTDSWRDGKAKGTFVSDLELCVRCIYANLCHPQSHPDAPHIKESIIRDILDHAVLFRARAAQNHCFWDILVAIVRHAVALLESPDSATQKEGLRLSGLILRSAEWEEKGEDGKIIMRAWDLADHLRETRIRQLNNLVDHEERIQLESCFEPLSRLGKLAGWNPVQGMLDNWPLP